MIYVHESNIKNKISSNYNNKSVVIKDFYEENYIPMRNEISKLKFDIEHKDDFIIATDMFNKYYDQLTDFSNKNGITSQSKFQSTFYEEISCYLFKDLPKIVDNTFDVFNKGIYAGLKIDSNGKISIITKDVDFCIGKKFELKTSDEKILNLILPIVSVEVKTYLDATMFGEIKSSSKALRSATPNSKAYVLMGYRDLKDEHIIAARNDSAINEMFVLRKKIKNKEKSKNYIISPIQSDVIYDYWYEISQAVENITDDVVPDFGKLLHP